MWRGRDWKSMFSQESEPQQSQNLDTDTDDADSVVQSLESVHEDNTEDECDEDMTEDECDENKIISSTLENIEQNKYVIPDDSEDNIHDSEDNIQENTRNQDCLIGVMSLLNQAVQDGLAVVLEDSCLDADVAYAKTVVFSKSAVPGPTFRLQRPKKVEMITIEKKEEGGETVAKDVVMVSDPKKGAKIKTKTNPRNRKKDSKENYLDVVPQATLRVDELAKLLG